MADADDVAADDGGEKERVNISLLMTLW